jgi:hypothetical protein
MNHKPQTLPHFSRSALLAAAIGAPVLFVALLTAESAAEATAPAVSAQETTTSASPDAAAQDPSTPESPAPTADALPAATEILKQSRGKLEELQTLKCDLHQTAMISGMKLVALGKYVEASGNRVNLQFHVFPMTGLRPDDAKAIALDAPTPELKEADSRGVLTQVSDGIVLYTSWKNGDAVRVTRRNIRDILAAASATSSYDATSAAMDLGVGGLRALIARLETTMDFAPVKMVKAGDNDVYEVTGKWNERIRKEVFQLPEGTVTDPRPQVPEYVRVYVDVATMLPRRIQYLKRSLEPTQKVVRPLLTLDIRNLVINEPVDDQTFVFTTPEKATEEDLTQQVIEMINQSVQPKQSPAATPESSSSATPAPAK